MTRGDRSATGPSVAAAGKIPGRWDSSRRGGSDARRARGRRGPRRAQRQETKDQGADKAAIQPTKLSPPRFHLTRQGGAWLTQWPSSSCGRSRDDLVLEGNASAEP